MQKNISAAQPAQAIDKKQHIKRMIPKIVLYVILIFFAVLWLIPFLFALSTSFAYNNNLYNGEPVIGI